MIENALIALIPTSIFAITFSLTKKEFLACYFAVIVLLALEDIRRALVKLSKKALVKLSKKETQNGD